MRSEPYRLYVNGPSPIVYFADDAYHHEHFLGEAEALRWVPPKVHVSNKSEPLKDMIMGYGTAPFVSEAFREAMQQLLLQHVEFLPLTILRKQQYYCLNVITIVDCLDMNKSSILYANDEPGKMLHIRSYVFIPNKLKGVPIFKIPQDMGAIFVSMEFLKMARDARLTGVGVDDPANVRLAKRDSPVAGFPT